MESTAAVPEWILAVGGVGLVLGERSQPARLLLSFSCDGVWWPATLPGPTAPPLPCHCCRCCPAPPCPALQAWPPMAIKS